MLLCLACSATQACFRRRLSGCFLCPLQGGTQPERLRLCYWPCFPETGLPLSILKILKVFHFSPHCLSKVTDMFLNTLSKIFNISFDKYLNHLLPLSYSISIYTLPDTFSDTGNKCGYVAAVSRLAVIKEKAKNFEYLRC